MSQLVELEKRMHELKKLAEVFVINIDNPQRTQILKKATGVSAPVLWDKGLVVSKKFDMHSRPGLPMGRMVSFPTMGFVIFDGRGIVRIQRSHLFFGKDAGLMLKALRSM